MLGPGGTKKSFSVPGTSGVILPGNGGLKISIFAYVLSISVSCVLIYALIFIQSGSYWYCFSDSPLGFSSQVFISEYFVAVL